MPKHHNMPKMTLWDELHAKANDFLQARRDASRASEDSVEAPSAIVADQVPVPRLVANRAPVFVFPFQNAADGNKSAKNVSSNESGVASFWNNDAGEEATTYMQPVDESSAASFAAALEPPGLKTIVEALRRYA
jgi:hypothetical protein